MQLPYLVDWSPRQRRQKLALMASRPSLVTPSGRFDVAQQQVSLSEDAKVEYQPVGLQEIQVDGKVNNGAVQNSSFLTSPGPAHRYK